jgi:hypothetical protein
MGKPEKIQTVGERLAELRAMVNGGAWSALDIPRRATVLEEIENLELMRTLIAKLNVPVCGCC